MSTKIYDAYRLRPGFDLWETITDITLRGRNRARRTLVPIIQALVDDPRDAKVLGLTIVSSRRAGYMDVSRAIRSAYKAQLGSSDRSFWDLSVSVAVHKVGRQYLFRAFGGSGVLSGSLLFMDRHPALEDYHYQDSSDRPKKISARAWAARLATWNRATLPDAAWLPFATLDLVSYNSFSAVDPSLAMARKAYRKEARRARRKRS